jgi:hypothetical protein
MQHAGYVSSINCNAHHRGRPRPEAFLNPQPLQRVLGYLPDALGTAVGTTRSDGTEVKAELGGDDHILSEWRQGLANQLFVREGAIHLGGVKERDPALDRCPDERDHQVSVRGGSAMMIQSHAAETDCRNFQCGAQYALLHD